MTDEEKKRMEHLERVEKSAQALVKAFTNQLDYNSWDKALDNLEALLRDKP
jgi:HD superfamily phosphohydrolase YqeK